jgi:hypothetical protein
MRGLFRIILLVGNGALFATLVYLLSTFEKPTGKTAWLVYGFLTLSGLNCLYFLLVPHVWGNRPSNWRIYRLVGLWFDAKESELRKRADRSRQDTRPHGQPGDRDE